MAKAYIRYTSNGEKVGSWGGNTKEVTEHFYSLMHSAKEHSSVLETYISRGRVGDVVLVELLKRGKSKPRLPRDFFIVVVEDLFRVENNRSIKAIVKFVRE